jgi:V8-like Glu-specific endopeptidase
MTGYETAIVRLRRGMSGQAAGLGVLVGQDQVVTCAHVVNTALGRGQRDQAAPGEQDTVLVDFPLLDDGAALRVARVAAWTPPPRAGNGGGDVAGLVLTEKAPDNAAAARFMAASLEPGTSPRVFGYPGSPPRSNGMHVDVTVKGEVGHRLLQVESRGDQSVKAQAGFSGSPVWDHATGQVAGLLQAAPLADDPERDAYLLVPLVIAQAWGEPFDYLLVPENPYRGLESFTAKDTSLFFGRDGDIRELASRVRAQPVVVVVGPSGVGKSSLVQAGLIPALQQDQRWSATVIRPGQDPWTRLAAGLLRAEHGADAGITREQCQREVDRLQRQGLGPTARFLRSQDRALLLVIDQFEELLADDMRADQSLLDLLLPRAGAAEDTARVVLTLRTDFLQVLQSIPGSHPRLNDRLYLLSPLTGAELREAVEQPAAARGVGFEPGLIDLILDEAAGTTLPVLQFALTRLWETQRGKTLTFAGYHDMEGVRGALDRFAQDRASRLGEALAEIADRVLLRLVRIPVGKPELATRHRVMQSQVPAVEWQVLQRLARAWLVTLGTDPATGESYAELAHEALITAWQRVADLVSQNAEFLSWLAWVQQRAADGDPLPDDRIAEARQWLTTRPGEIPAPVIRFVQQSETAAEARLLTQSLHGGLGQRQRPPRLSRLGVAAFAHRTPYRYRRRHGPRRARIPVQVDVLPAQLPGLLGADPRRQAQHDVGVQPGLPGRIQQRQRLLQSERAARPPDLAFRVVDQRRHVPADQVVRLGVPDRPSKGSPAELQVPGRHLLAERLEPLAHVAGRQLPERPGADLLQQRLERLVVDRPSAVRPALQPALEPVVHRVLDRVGGRRVQAAVELVVRRLELVPHLGLGPAADLAPDPFPARPEADRGRPDVAVLRRVEVFPVSLDLAGRQLGGCNLG